VISKIKDTEAVRCVELNH